MQKKVDQTKLVLCSVTLLFFPLNLGFSSQSDLNSTKGFLSCQIQEVLGERDKGPIGHILGMRASPGK